MADPWEPVRRRTRGAVDQGEQDIRAGWLAVARGWTSRVLGPVMAPFRQAGQLPDASLVLAQQQLWEDLLATSVRPPLLRTLRAGWALVTGQQPPDYFDTAANTQQYLTDSLNLMVRTPDSVYRLIAATISDGLNGGEAIPDIAARVQAVLESTSTEFWTNRATLVARTEAQRAVNAGQFAAGLAEQVRTGALYVKTWLATEDTRTRPEHREADGQQVPLDQPFMVGGVPLAYPGDPLGPPHLTIQCRCSFTVERSSEPPTSRADRQNP
jgi:hypothetical protein